MSRSRMVCAPAALVLVLAVLMAGCGDDEDRGTEPTTDTSTPSADGAPPTTPPGATTLPPLPSTTESTTTVAPPQPVGPALQIRRGNPDRMTVALTFDAGSDAGSTIAVLDTLAANGIRASFGVTGAWAEHYPDLLRRMVADGHQLLNHSYDHPSFTGFSTGRPALTGTQRADQLTRAEEVFSQLGATARPWFRPPYGDTDASVDADLGAAGYRYDVLWTVDSLGWKGIAVDEIIARCLDGAAPGAILMFHVGSASTDLGALQPIIDGLRVRGYGFDTVAGVVG